MLRQPTELVLRTSAQTFEVPSASEVEVRVMTFEDNTATAWHAHQAPVLVVVNSGQFTRQYEDCSTSVHGPGEVSIHPGQPVDRIHRARAAEVKAIIDHLGIERAHFVGQAGGGVILLQVLRAFPEVVHTVALLEPALIPVIAAGETSQSLMEAMARADSPQQASDDAGVADTFISEVCGEDYRVVFARTMPEGWFERFCC